MSNTGRGDFDGIDNEALDFSQLQDYINEDNDSSLYFHEALVGSESSKTTNPFHCESAPATSSTESAYYNNTPSVTSIYKITCERPSLSKSSEQARHPSLNVSTSSVVVQTQPHHLPDSPPDSGSEPPFSPPHEDPKLTQGRTSQLEKMQSQTESLKHYITYGNTQPLKHLPDTSLNVTPPHQHSPHQTQPGNHPLLSHNSSVPVITQLSPAIPSPMTVVSSVQPPLPSLVATGTHLGNIFPNSDDYICEDLDSPTNNPSKKRKLSDSSKNVVNHLINGIVHVKQEPAVLSPEPASTSSIIPSTDEDYSFEFGSEAASMFMDSTYQCIKFHQFQPNTWHVLLDRNLKELPPPNYRVDADKGFNFSNADDAFVCQKKNHFQVTTHVQPIGEPHFVKTPEGVKQIENFYLHFHGAKVESPSQMIKVEQSQSDRSKKPFYPVLVELAPEQVTKTTVGRLHFSETTSNNMRKKGKPNPDQRYFYLVVSLCAHVVEDQSYQIIAHASERIIVRASNPGQFENDMELCWQKGHSADSIYHAGRVGINTDRPEESLVVHGNVKISGHIVQPSDSRVKRSVEELDTKLQLKNVANMRIVKYRYISEFGKQVGLKEEDLSGTGVLAQDVKEILPDAVREIGKVVLSDGKEVEQFLVVNKERIFMENVGAVKELCKVTDKLETRIDELERMNKKLTRLKRIDSIKSTSSGSTVTSRCSTVTNAKKMLHRHRCHSQMNQSLLCTNHLVQATIIILLLVMAFCLAAMATLYILEWHKWHEFQSSSRMLLSVAQETQRSILSENNATTSSSLSNSFSSRLSMPTWTTPDSGTSSNTHSLEAQHLPLSSTISSSSISTTYSTRSPTLSGWGSPLKTWPKEIGTPQVCVEHAGACSVMCCASVGIPHQDVRNSVRVRDSIHSQPVTQNSSIHRHNTDYVVDDGDSKGDKESNETEENKGIEDYPSTLLEHDENFGMEVVGDNSAVVESQTPLSRSKRSGKEPLVHIVKRRDLEGKEDSIKDSSQVDISQQVEFVHLVELNTTLDDTYCESVMRDNVAAIYTCHIPLSKYMNLDNVTLDFRLRQSLAIVKCQTSDVFTDCPSQQSTHRVIPNIEGHGSLWRLPVGVYLRSYYVFRILSPNTATQTSCSSLPAEEAGLRFLEYRLIFRRVCDK